MNSIKNLNKYSWEDIHDSVNDGLAEYLFAYGAKKDVYNKKGFQVGTAYLVGKRHDILDSGSGGTARTTWIALDSKICGPMHDQIVKYNGYEGWDNSYAREYLNGYFFEQLPDCLQEAIKPVTKISDAGTRNEFGEHRVTKDRVWLPALEELGIRSSQSHNPLAVPYQGINVGDKNFQGENQLFLNKKKSNGKIVGSLGWLRSTYFGCSDMFWTMGQGESDFEFVGTDLFYPFSFCI